MIARAMNTGPAERLSFRELARQGAQLERACALSQFERLTAAIVAEEDRSVDDATVRVDLVFRLDEAGRVRVDGSAALATELLCHRCAELVAFPLQAAFSLCLVAEAEARELAEQFDVLVVAGKEISVPEIVEDELLLALPENLCRDEPCERLPALAYPADEAAEVDPKPSPFAALGALKVAKAGEQGAED